VPVVGGSAAELFALIIAPPHPVVLALRETDSFQNWTPPKLTLGQGSPIEVVQPPQGFPTASTDFRLFDLEKKLKETSQKRKRNKDDPSRRWAKPETSRRVGLPLRDT